MYDELTNVELFSDISLFSDVMPINIFLNYKDATA